MDREKLVTDNLDLVHMMLRKYRIPKGYDYDDMFQEGCIGLCMASKEFDPTKGYKFSTIATTCIVTRFFKIFRAQSTAKRTGICISIYMPIVEDDTLELLDTIPDHIATYPEEEVIASETLNMLVEADEELVSFRLNGMTQVDIGQALGISQVHVSRKLKKLRDLVV
jgi:RNA polymerase sporulation-specific sigma factor